MENYDLRNHVRNTLKNIGDLLRLATRITYSNTANARDLLSIKDALINLTKVQKILLESSHPLLEAYGQKFHDYTGIITSIECAIADEPPITITEGNIIKFGYDAKVDELRGLLKNGKDWVLKYEVAQKKLLNVNSGLKITYNSILGYFIQITLHTLKSVTIPANYQKRQELKGNTRYDTEELKTFETKILNAGTDANNLEYKIFQTIREQVQTFTEQIQNDAQLLAKIDVLSCFAEVSQNQNYTRPDLNDGNELQIIEGRHPVVEYINSAEPFIPNDAAMNGVEDQILIITGPNWSGKSTYLRQVALIVLMAQIGCYVPARSAKIGIVARIFTRVGASDDLTKGQSTFMLEMNEMAEIINYTTENSLIIIDELGRGTGTVDGQSIAQAVIEYLHDFGVKTLFSTHFHQLIYMDLPRIKNYHFKILEKEETKELVFLRKLIEGGTEKSFGVHVARMAGLPQRVIDRAFNILEIGLNNDEPVIVKAESNPIVPKKKSGKKVQMTLFPMSTSEKVDSNDEITQILNEIDINDITPLQAFDYLRKLKKKMY